MIAGVIDIVKQRLLFKRPSSFCNLVIFGSGLLISVLALNGLSWLSPFQENAAILKWVFIGQAICGFLLSIYSCWILLCVCVNRTKTPDKNIVES